MSNKLDDLINKFKEEDNTAGERIAEALKDYLCDFTQTLKDNVVSQQNSTNRVVNKIKNMMIDCADRGDYTARHMFPLVLEKDFNILSREIDDSVVLERINSGIKKYQSGSSVNGIEIASYKYKIPVGYIYTNVTKNQLENMVKNEKYSLTVVDKTGEKRKLDYYLVSSEIAISKCKKMWQLTNLYKDEEPILFAPYAKRLFRIEIDIEQILSNQGIQIESIDFMLEKNGLDKVLMLGKELVWNVKTEEQTEFIKKKAPVADVIHWKYYFKDLLSYQYIVPKILNWCTFRIDNISDKDICFDFENEYFGQFEKVSIFDINERDFEKQDLFWLQYNLQKLNRQSRIRSLSDAYYEVKKFEPSLPSGLSIKNVQQNLPEGKNIVEKYPVNMTVYDKGRFGYKNTNRLFVVFECESNDLMVLDYINLILGYLTFCFPEIGWEGAI